MPLKKIPFILSPVLLKVLCEMGHGDTIVFADAHFPSSSLCKHSGAVEIRMDGNTIPEILHGVLELFPLDTYVLAPVTLMQVVPHDVGKVIPTIWDSYKEIVKKHEPDAGVQMLERFDFYEAAKNAYGIVHTGETSQYGNIILKKGIVLPEPALAENSASASSKSNAKKRPADSAASHQSAEKKVLKPGNDNTGLFTWTEESLILLVKAYHSTKSKTEVKGLWRKDVRDIWFKVKDAMTAEGFPAHISKDKIRMKYNKITLLYRNFKDLQASSNNPRKSPPRPLTPALMALLEQLLTHTPCSTPADTLSAIPSLFVVSADKNVTKEEQD